MPPSSSIKLRESKRERDCGKYLLEAKGANVANSWACNEHKVEYVFFVLYPKLFENGYIYATEGMK